MRNRIEWRDARVAETRQIADDVRLITFAVDGLVPPFDPGSHINVGVESRARPPSAPTPPSRQRRVISPSR